MELHETGSRLLLGWQTNIGNLSGDSVKIPTALGGETTSTVGVLLHNLQLLEGLERLAGNGAGSTAPMAGHGTVVTATSIDLADG